MLNSKLLFSIAIRPQLWFVALRQALRLAPGGWWKRWPFIPVPDKSLLEMRSIIAYGSDGTVAPPSHDVITYLQWCKDVGKQC